MTTENDIIEFLRSRLDDDETAALRATPPGMWTVEPDDTGEWTVVDEDAGETVTRGAAHYTAHHIAHHHPDRALREVRAKRLILDQAPELAPLLAAIYSDHPRYPGRQAP